MPTIDRTDAAPGRTPSRPRPGRWAALLLAALAACASPAPTAAPDDAPGPPRDTAPPAPPTTERLTPADESWFDPEVLDAPGGPLLTWQDGDGRIRLARLDATTGLPRPGGISTLADRAAPLSQTFNGPEFGLDATGWAVFYTRRAGDGTYQVARVRDAGGVTMLDVLTSGPTHFSPLASKDADADATRLILLRRPPTWGTAMWFVPGEPSGPVAFATLAERTDLDARWIDGTTAFATNNHPADPGALAVVETATGAVRRVAAPDARVGDPYGWRAPEAGGGLMVLASLGDTAVGVWREGAAGWERYHVLASPVASLPYVGSPEPFVANGESWVSLVASSTPGAVPGVSTQEVWLVRLDPARPAEVRCDDGAPGAVTRADPETLVAAGRVFVFYYTLAGTRSVAYRCATDLPPS